MTVGVFRNAPTLLLITPHPFSPHCFPGTLFLRVSSATHRNQVDVEELWTRFGHSIGILSLDLD